MIVAPPKPVSQKVFPDLLSTVDVAATIAALGGVDLPKAVDGRSLLPVVTNEPVALRKLPGCISEFGKRLMLETERYKVVFDMELHAATGLYDRLEDPDELENLIGSPVAVNVMESLRGRLCDILIGLRALPGISV